MKKLNPKIITQNRSLHDWVLYHKGHPRKCSQCGQIGLYQQHIHWANIDHKYRRNLDDYISLCISCHGKYDTLHGLRKLGNKITYQGKTMSLYGWSRLFKMNDATAYGRQSRGWSFKKIFETPVRKI